MRLYPTHTDYGLLDDYIKGAFDKEAGYLELLSAAFLQQVGSAEASKYALTRRPLESGTGVCWQFEQRHGPFPNTDLDPYLTMLQDDPPTLPHTDDVNHPTHYKKGGIETIDVLQAKLSPEEFEGFCIGNALKYITRRHYKGKARQDLEKAHWYLTRALGRHLSTFPIKIDSMVEVPPDDIIHRNCIQPGCAGLQITGRLYCEDHITSKGGGNAK